MLILLLVRLVGGIGLWVGLGVERFLLTNGITCKTDLPLTTKTITFACLTSNGRAVSTSNAGVASGFCVGLNHRTGNPMILPTCGGRLAFIGNTCRTTAAFSTGLAVKSMGTCSSCSVVVIGGKLGFGRHGH